MPGSRRSFPRLSDNRVIAPAQTALALELITPMDFLRLKSIARLYARGLPAHVAWDDLLQEAITRVLTGKRLKHGDVSMVAFLAGVMRSLRSDHLRRARPVSETEVLDPVADPERTLIAAEELDKIRLLFAGDELARAILEGLAEGLTAEQIRARHALTKTDYDSARKRMRRHLLREGLTCSKT